MRPRTPRRKNFLPVRLLPGLVALAAGGLALARSLWLGDTLAALLLPRSAPLPAGQRPADVVRDMPGIDHPRTVSADAAGLEDDTPVLGVTAGGQSRAYLLEAFATGPGSHIVNDLLGGVPVSVSHCNLSGCSRAFKDDGPPGRHDQPLDLSGGGLKGYRLVLKSGGHAYEQETGAALDQAGPPFPFREHPVERTSWGAWLKAHPDTDVYLGTIPPGTSSTAEPATRNYEPKRPSASPVPCSAPGQEPVLLGASVLLLLAGFVVLLPLLPRWVSRLLIVLWLLGGLAVLVPGSPVSLSALLVPRGGFYDGHGTRYWLRTLGSPDGEARGEAIFALGVIGPDQAEVVPGLARILVEDPDAEARHQAALAMLKMGPAARAAVPELARALADEEPAVRMNAAVALARLGAEGRPAVPALIEAVERKGNRTNLGTFSFTIQEMAARARGRASAGSTAGVTVLTRALKAARSAQVRRGLARALGEVGPAARPAVPQLQALLRDETSEVRETAAEALKKIENEGPPGRTAPTDRSGTGWPLR
jgi:hypothetical protein